MFLEPKIKYCLTIIKIAIIDEHKTFIGFTNVGDNLDRKKITMADGGKLIAKFPLSWNKSFSMGVVIPHKRKSCGECWKDTLCDNCNKLLYQRKFFCKSK